jgi:uncharacterized protein YkvS
VGVYPVGSVIELNPGETGIVKRMNHDAPLVPVILIVKGTGNALLYNPNEKDLAKHEKTLNRSVRASLHPQQTGIDPTLYLDKKAA